MLSSAFFVASDLRVNKHLTLSVIASRTNSREKCSRTALARFACQRQKPNTQVACYIMGVGGVGGGGGGAGRRRESLRKMMFSSEIYVYLFLIWREIVMFEML